MRRNKVRLTESQLHNVIKESVKRVLMEGNGKFDKLYYDKNWAETEENIQYQNIINSLEREYEEVERIGEAYERRREELAKQIAHYTDMSWDEFCYYAKEKYGLSRENMDSNWGAFCDTKIGNQQMYGNGNEGMHDFSGCGHRFA